MPRRTKDGRFLLSAGEIGAYTVCPESWRLREVVRAKSTQASTISKGRDLHQKWADDVDQSLSFARAARLVILLLLIAIGTFLLAR